MVTITAFVYDIKEHKNLFTSNNSAIKPNIASLG